MIKNYLKTAWRNIWKNKVFSAINVIGLSVGLAACILIMLFVSYEKGFDSFHTKNIYRLNEVQKFPGMVSSQKVALSMFPMGPALRSEYPQIKQFTRIHWEGDYQLTEGEKKVYLQQAFFVDTTFFNMFNFALLKGDRTTALGKPHSLVLTEKSAKKIFGDVDPIGKTITHYGGDTVTYTITGIAANPPKNSQLQFDCIASFSSIFKPWMFTNWGGNWLDTYFEFEKGTNVSALEKQMPAFLKRHMKGDGWKYYELFYLPLKEVHAHAGDIGLDYLNYEKFDASTTNLFLTVAIIVLIIACINFINLSTARSAERAKEVGIRKSVGAHRFQLASQFLGETVLLALIALVFAVAMVELALPYVNSLSDRELSLPIFTNPATALLVIICTVIVGLISGIYPAAYLSHFQPVKVLKGSIQTGRSKGVFRNVLVVIQFMVAVFLMIGTIFVVKQLYFMQHKDPGFSRDQIVTVPVGLLDQKQYDLLKKELLGSTLVNGVTASQDNLGSHLDQSGVTYKPSDGPERNLTGTRLIVDPDYISLYKIKLDAGQNFSEDKTRLNKEYIINEEMAKELLKDQPGKPMSSLLGERFGFDSLGTIRGIAKNFNFNSLHYKIETLFILAVPGGNFSTMSVKINGGQIPAALNFVKNTWTSNFPDIPYSYQFLDDHFKEVYRIDTQESQVVGIMAVLIIIVSCLGLFGLASYAAEKRIKEIGIRKVLGASVQNVTVLLTRHFLMLVVIGNVIAWPLAWLTVRWWLRDFAYHIDVQLWVFIAAGLASILIAFLTVSFQSIKAAVANPVKSLRSE